LNPEPPIDPPEVKMWFWVCQNCGHETDEESDPDMIEKPECCIECRADEFKIKFDYFQA
jgi:DNA replicative helicase MCM subunit Mcm2 (Cdc46/Mcm family)